MELLQVTILVLVLVNPGAPLNWLNKANKAVLTTATDNEDSPYRWKEKSKYYYNSMAAKVEDIVNGRKCATTITKSNLKIDFAKFDSSNAHFDFVFIELSVDAELLEWWKRMPPPRQMRVDPLLCDIVYTKKNPIFNNTGCQLPDYMSGSAPRCQTSYLRWICLQSSIDIESKAFNGFTLPESVHAATFMPPVPYLAIATNSFVTLCGQVIGQCGMLHSTANCKARGYKSQGAAFQKRCSFAIQNKQFEEFETMVACRDGTPFSQNVTFLRRVFVVAEVDDTYIYHIHLEILPRIIAHLPFLLENPDIKILIGCDSKKDPKATASGLRQGMQAMKPLLHLAGLTIDRFIVHQHVFSKEIYFPMEGGCQDPIYNTWQILHMRNFFLQQSGVNRENMLAYSSLQYGPPTKLDRPKDRDRHSYHRPFMLILKRSSNSKHTRNGHDLVRQWSDSFADTLLQQFRNIFARPNRNTGVAPFAVDLLSDRNHSMMNCHDCMVRLFHSVDVLVAVHGAGLANMIYMKPNSVVIELCPYGNDGRCLLGGGPFSRAAALMSHNYLIHHPPYEEFVWVTQSKSSEFNVTRFVNHIYSFLFSLGLVD